MRLRYGLKMGELEKAGPPFLLHTERERRHVHGFADPHEDATSLERVQCLSVVVSAVLAWNAARRLAARGEP